ncbi:ABC transporter permease [Methanoplanus endosymbiosus]|uniref:ABC transporter permease n=1 Tax=Methanoplanus endosymbiosus TaxID=33865 RepID=A0A9E7TJ67_9EURY|nr:ABC transporter permease [Methanoplanus endosymbiosus]UUX91440.1 ABC transporter permease [Methanoplanus endosymbiosus]
MNSKTLKIAGHEFKKTVIRKGFIFGTFVLPLLIVLVFGLVFSQMPAIEEGFSDSGDLGFIDNSGVIFPSGKFIQYDSRSSASQAVAAGDISEYFVVPQDYIESGNITVYSENSPLSSGNSIGDIEEFLRGNIVEISVNDPVNSGRIISPVSNAGYVTIGSEGEEKESKSAGMILITFCLSFMLVFSILTSSGYLMQGIGEEKESRSGELILSSVSADQLLRGKVLGYGGVGFLQMGVWLAMAGAVILLIPVPGLFEDLSLSWMFILTLVYFVLGYFLYSVSISCTASIASTSAEAQQTSMIFTMFAVIPLIMLQFIMAVPDSPLAVILSYFPYTSPFIMMFRIALGDVPAFEIFLSLAVLAVSIMIAVKLSAKIFRAGMLMYGKKPSLREILKYLKN